MPSKINTTAVPFRSSRLAVPPSPFSPVDITPTTPLERTYSATANATLLDILPPPTRQPMNWLWACHMCRRQYNLSVTRRCLDDGHYFCAGTSIVRCLKDGSRRLRRHKACASEFDYAGWKDWGVWKRNLLTLTEQQKQRNRPCDSVFDGDDSEDEDLEEISSTATVVSPIVAGVSSHTSSWKVAKPIRPAKDCCNRCDYPSECRWGKQFGVDTPVQASFPSLERVLSTLNPNESSTGDIADVEMTDASSATLPPTRFEAILTADQQATVADKIDGVDLEVPHTHTATPALADLASLVSRAQRRHSRSETPVSPLAGVKTHQTRPSMTTRSSSRESLRRAVEGGIGVIAGIVGGWRSSSAPPGNRNQAEDEKEKGGEDIVMEDVDAEVEERGRGRRRSLG
ncbi:hypothetical protein E4T44_02740 [Aureobasidium sp. EXF-8845]|nr:hypothetical protein E4T44_02740 [Aureobasidium sp. EXF-8845]KAI4855858.1 hypothetical protein E4T45_02697 [Aureobasidium sp. EXF-8846]